MRGTKPPALAPDKSAAIPCSTEAAAVSDMRLKAPTWSGAVAIAVLKAHAAE